MALQSGLTGTARSRVERADTATALGSGDVPVLGTPRVVALAEAATVAALAGHLPDGMTSVGTRIHLDHLLPSTVGADVVAEATLSDLDGRLLGFTVVVRDGDAVAARGRIERVVVDRDKFLSRANSR
jgi:fluoroacetyl-CoA thioesterase